MAKAIAVRGGRQVKWEEDREVGGHSLPTMADTGEIDLRRFARIIYRRRWILLFTMAATMSTTLYWVLQAVPLYSADVLILIEPRESSIVNIDGRSMSTDTAVVNTEVAVLDSRGLAATVIRELELDKDPEFAATSPAVRSESAAFADGPVGASSAGAPASDGVGRDGSNPWVQVRAHLRSLSSAVASAQQQVRSFFAARTAGGDVEVTARDEIHGSDNEGNADARAAAALLERFLSRVSVDPEGQSRLIRVGFTSSDPAKAALIANKIVGTYMETQMEAKTEGARRAAKWLETRLAELAETVRSLQQRVQKQRVESGSNGLEMVSQRLANLNTQLVTARAATAAAAARYEQVRTVLENGGDLNALPTIIASTTVQALRAKLTEEIARMSDLRTIYGERHPQIVALRAEISQVEQRLKREIETTVAGLRNELESAQLNEAALQSDLVAVSEKVVELKEAEASIGQVAQELQANQDLYGSLLKRYTEAMALRDNQPPDARVISPAQVPLSPSHPNFPRVIALSFVGSASLAIFLLVISERLRQKLDTVEDVEQQIGLQVIGTIPDLPRLQRLVSAPGAYVQREPLSEFGGAFQRLRALLTLCNRRVMPRTVLVTSCAHGEGKTTIAVCLGIASLSSGQKVLLVDCDFARPQVHRMLGVENEKGLTDILKGTATLEEAITQTAGSNLSVLTVGRSPHGAIDLLNSARMERLLIELKRAFDIIILDSAPVQVSNALILGGLAEKTIVVIRRSWTSHRNASYALKQLEIYGADIAGVVFNRASAAANYASGRFR